MFALTVIVSQQVSYHVDRGRSVRHCVGVTPARLVNRAPPGATLYQKPASFSFNFSPPILFPNLSKNFESTVIHFCSS